MISKLIGVIPGAHVKVGFVVDSREWTDPKTGKVRYYTDLSALSLEIDGRNGLISEPTNQLDKASFADEEEEPPF